MKRVFSNTFAGLLFAALVCLCGVSNCGTAYGQALRDVDEHAAGDAPADPGPPAHDLSAKLSHASVKAAMRKVGDWQLARVKDEASQDWTFATLYLGLLEASNTLHDTQYMDYVKGVGGALSLDAGSAQNTCRRPGNRAILSVALWPQSRSAAPCAVATTV